MKFLCGGESDHWLSARSIVLSSEQFPLVGQSTAIELPLNGETSQALLFGYLFSSLDESFKGGLFVYRDWNINSPDLDRIGQQIVLQLLAQRTKAQGRADEPDPILLDASEESLLPALALQAAIFGWDAFFVPSSGNFLLYISHERNVFLISKMDWDHEVSLQIANLKGDSIAVPYYLSLSTKQVTRPLSY